VSHASLVMLTGSTALTQLRQRVEEIEVRQKGFVDDIAKFRQSIMKWDEDVFESDVSLPVVGLADVP
jgi:hypothetical protein